MRRGERAEAGTHAHPPLGMIAIGTLWRYQLCGCMRDIKESTPVCTFFRPSCAQKTSLTNESEVSFPSNRRISVLMCGWWCWAS